MAFFNKNRKVQAPNPVLPPTPECLHKYKDFPWYVESICYNYENRYKITVTEPYVCIHCGNRIDKVLWRFESSGTKKDADKLKETILEKYGDKIADRVVIEDEIADLQLVDREYIKFYDLIKSGKLHPIELKLE